MRFLTDDEREVLLKEYELLHKENWERGQAVWIVNSILITGSLIAAFQSTAIVSIPTSTVSLLLVIVAFVYQATTDKVTAITYRTMEEIRETLGMTRSTRMYNKMIKGKWWYIIRRNLPYSLYLILACTFVFLASNDAPFSYLIGIGGFFMIALREKYDQVKREVENTQRGEAQTSLDCF